MRRAAVVAVAVTLAILLMLPASAAAGLGFTVQDGFASPTVALGSAKSAALCDIGIKETRLAPWPGGIPPAVDPVPPPPPCSRQPGVRPLVVARARAARVTLKAPADRLIPAWYRNGRLEPLTATRTGRLSWRLTLPPTSGRLLLGLEFDLDDGLPFCCTREMRLDWKLSIRRRPAAPGPAPAPPVVPIDAPSHQELTGSG